MKRESMDSNILKSILRYVRKNNNHYSEIYIKNETDPTLEEFPVLTRKDLQVLKQNLLSTHYRGKLYNTLLKATTSGSSGMPVWVYWDRDDYLKSMSTMWRRRKRYYGILPTSKQVNFSLNIYTNIDSNDLIYSLSNYVLSINKGSLDCKKNIYDAYKKICEFEPVWIYCQPHALEPILDYMEKKQLKFKDSCKYVELVGEMCTEKIRRQILLCIPSAKISNMYGSEEMNTIGYECPNGNMHVLSENVCVECLSSAGIEREGRGEAIVTNLHNRAMPLIRYNQGDIIELSPPVKCSCGYEDALILKIEGRIRDSFECGNNIITAYFLSQCIEIVNNKYNNPIVNYKFELVEKYSQDTILYSNIILEEKYNSWKAVILEELEAQLRKKVTDDVKIEYLSKIDDFKNSKEKFKILVKRIMD